MSRRREVITELLVRIAKVDKIISDWMRKSTKPEATPEDCMPLLVEQGINTYNLKGNAHNFRKDLRTLRDCGRLDVLKQIKVEQKASGSR